MTMFHLTHVLRWSSPPQNSPCATFLSFVLLVALAAVTTVAFVPIQEVGALAPNEVLQRHLDAGTTHTYRLIIAAQQYAQIFVDQKGVDLILTVESPDGKVYREIDNPNGFYGPEIVTIVAPVAGTYAVKISNRQFLAGDYELRLDGPREATVLDKRRVTAEQLFAEAQDMRGEARGVDEKYESAIRKYHEALELWRELGSLREHGYCFINIARSYKTRAQGLLLQDDLRQFYLDQAFNNFREALSVLAADPPGQAFALNEAGATHRDFGDPREALSSYKKALKLRLALGDRYGQAQLHNNLGLTYSYIGYQPKALEHLREALSRWRELGIRDREMNTIINIGKAQVEMGDVDAARSQFQEVLAYCEIELNKKDSLLKRSASNLKPFALNGMGLVYDTWANPQLAQTNYKEALDLFHANGENAAEADVLDNLGLMHAFLGDPWQARDYFQDALVIRKRLNQPKRWGVTLSNLGYAYTLMGNDKEALKQLSLALPFTKLARDMRFQAYTLVRMGMAYVALNEPRKALKSYEEAFAIQQDPEFMDRRGQAITLDKMAEALALSGQVTQALEKYKEAIERWRNVGDQQGEALSLYGIAKIERDRFNLTQARDQIEEAIRIVETLRHRVTKRQLQMLYFSGKHDLYALAIDVRTQLYETTKSRADMEAALSLSEQGRARTLLDLLTEADSDLPNGMTAEVAEKNARMQGEISELSQTLFRFRSVGAKEEAAVVQKALEKEFNEQDELLALARSNGASPPQSHPLTAPQIQQLLDDNTMVLEYSLDKKRSHLWSVTRARIDHHFLAGRAKIEAAAKDLGQSLTSYEQKRRPGESDEEYLRRLRQPTNQYRVSALKLSRLVLGKVWTQLGDKRLVIIADGALQYIPFEILPLPQSAVANRDNSLLSKNEVVYQPSASTLALLRDVRRPIPSKAVVVFADPMLPTDNKGTDSSSAPYTSKEKLISSLRDTGEDDFPLPRLRYSLKEAEAIIAIAPQSSMKAVGLEANRALVTSSILKQFDIVHFATHGIVNDKQPELSGIVLSDGYLTLRDIYHLDLPIHLIVLSACRTGIGKEVRGEGLIGLTRGFMHAGVQSVVVSLWRVDDEATAELMKLFYSHMFGKNRLPPATALRQAKLEMKAHSRERWRAPYYWAGFVLQGDWK